MSKVLRFTLFTLLGLVVLGSIASAGYFYREYRLVVGDTQKAEEIQHTRILATIAKFMQLPEEKPSIVTITDRDKLQNQEFFQKAENGDKIIIYETAKRVLLYRPSTRKVIDVAPLVYNQDNVSGATTEAPPLDLIVSPPASPTAEFFQDPNASPSGY